MFLRAERPVESSAQAFILYMYTADLIGLRSRLLTEGVRVPSINYPEYMHSGKINIADPDGYKIEIAHWGKPEQEVWEKKDRREVRRCILKRSFSFRLAGQEVYTNMLIKWKKSLKTSC